MNKLARYDIDNVTRYFEEQILASNVEDPAAYSFVSTKPLQCTKAISKKVANALRRMPGINVEDPTYENLSSKKDKFLPDGKYYSGILDKTINTKDFKLDKDTLNRLGINTNNNFETMKNTLAANSGMLPAISEVGAMLKALNKATESDLTILNSTMTKTNYDTTKKAMANLVGIMPLSLFSTYFKENPTCGLDGQVAEAAAKPVMDKFMSFMNDSVYTGRKNKTMPNAIKTSMATLNKLAGSMKEDLYKMMDIAQNENDSRVKEVSNLNTNYVAKRTIEAKKSFDMNGAAEKIFSIPMGEVMVDKNGVKAALDALPKPNTDTTNLLDKVDNASTEQIKKIFDSRVGQKITKYFS